MWDRVRSAVYQALRCNIGSRGVQVPSKLQVANIKHRCRGLGASRKAVVQDLVNSSSSRINRSKRYKAERKKTQIDCSSEV